MKGKTHRVQSALDGENSMISKQNVKAYTALTAVDFRVIFRKHSGGIRRMSPLRLRKRTEKIRELRKNR